MDAKTKNAGVSKVIDAAVKENAVLLMIVTMIERFPASVPKPSPFYDVMREWNALKTLRPKMGDHANTLAVISFGSQGQETVGLGVRITPHTLEVIFRRFNMNIWLLSMPSKLPPNYKESRGFDGAETPRDTLVSTSESRMPTFRVAFGICSEEHNLELLRISGFSEIKGVAKVPPMPAKELHETKINMKLLNCPSCDFRFNTFTRGMMCSKCKIVKYCNQVCQRKHWPKHKLMCEKHTILK